MDFKKAFQFPLKNEHGLVFTADNNRAFDFAQTWLYPNGLHSGPDNRKEIIECLNGNGKKIQTDLKLSYADSIIYSDMNGKNQEFIIMRGWGMLTGTGGLNLVEEVACKIQDDFAGYIISCLTVHPEAS